MERVLPDIEHWLDLPCALIGIQGLQLAAGQGKAEVLLAPLHRKKITSLQCSNQVVKTAQDFESLEMT